MNLRSGSRYNTILVCLLALCCQLLPNSAIPPQDSTDAPCSLQQERPLLLSDDKLQDTFDIDVTEAEVAEQSSAHDALLAGGSPQGAPASEPPAHSGVQPEYPSSPVEGATADPDGRQTTSIPLDVVEAPGVANETALTSDSPANVSLPAELLPPPASVDVAEAETAGASEPAVQVGEQEDEEERHNFALAKDGAKVVAANKEARKAESILDSDGDTFLKNECRADKWVLVELSQVTKVDLIKLSQYELYSSRVRDFEVFGRQSHPRTDGTDYARHLNSSSWQLLGKFTAGNLKGTQAFPAQQPAWAKYLQLRFLTHYGTEPVCALNDVRVYGKSAVEDLEDRLALEAAPDSDEEQEQGEKEAVGAEAESQAQAEPQAEAAGKEGVVGTGQPAKGAESSEGTVTEPPPVSKTAVDSKTASESHTSEQKADGADVEAGADKPLEEKKAAAVSEPGKVDNGSTAVPGGQAAAAGAGTDVATEVLEVLSAGLKRLISPPGTGKKRATFSGKAATSIDTLPLPEAPIEPAGDNKGIEGQGTVTGQQQGTLEADRAENSPKPPADKRELIGSVPIVVEDQTAAVLDANSPVVAAVAGPTTEIEAAAGAREAKAKNGQALEKELLLAANSAGSSKARNGGTVYDILVSEIKALKLQQKMVPRALSDLQKNVTAAVTSIAAELSSFHQRISDLEAISDAPTMCAAEEGDGPGAGGFTNESAGRSSYQLAPQQDGIQSAGGLQQGLDMQAIALELGALRTAAERANRREFAMIMIIAMLCALLVLCLPRIGSQNPIFRGAVVLLALANGCVGLLLHYANALPALEKGGFHNVQGFVRI